MRTCKGLARCSKGRLGIVLTYAEVAYNDGSTAKAFVGRQFPQIWKPWSSRNPHWIILL